MASAQGEVPAPWKSLKRVAWIRTGALGDLVVGLAALSEMSTFFPMARLTVVGPAQWLEILSPQQFPALERVAVVERRSANATMMVPGREGWIPEKRSDGSRDIPLVDFLATCDGVVNTNIDSLRYGFMAWRAGVPVRVGSAASPMTWVYTDSSPYFGKDPLVHERDVALLLLELASRDFSRHFHSVARNRRHLGEIVASSRLIQKWRQLGLPQAKVPDHLRARALTGRDEQTYLLVNPTASRREKTWPSERMRALLAEMSQEFSRLKVVPIVIGAPSETAWLNEVAGSEYRVVQPRSLDELQDVVAGARALLTNGSSMQFIAATTQTPVLTIFGRGQPLVWGPVGPKDRFVRAKFAGAHLGQTFAGLEEEERTYRTIEVSDVAKEFRVFLEAL